MGNVIRRGKISGRTRKSPLTVAGTARGVLSFYAGFAMAGVAAALAIPVLPLRLSAACAALFCFLLVRRLFDDRTILVILLSYVWFWMIGCVVVAGIASSSLLLSLSLALVLPAAVSGFRHRRFFTSLPDVGVVCGAAAIAAVAAGLCFVPGTPVLMEPRRLFGMVVCCLIAYCAVRGAATAAEAGRLRGIALAVVSVCCVSLAFAVGLWLMSLSMARYFEADGRIEKALIHAQAEERLARRLDVGKAIAHALHRQSELHLAAGRTGLWRSTLKDAVLADPDDCESLSVLLADAFNRSERGDPAGALDALHWFGALPDAWLDRSDAERIVRHAAIAEDWPSFARAWRLCDGKIPMQTADRLDPARAGKALYFGGRQDVATALLEAAADRGHADRESIGMLVVLYVKGGLLAEAEALLEATPGIVPPAEMEYLRFLADGVKDEEGGVDFENTVRLLRCGAAESTVQAGGVLRIDFSWRALAPVNPSWKVFVHVRRETCGEYFFQGDHSFSDAGVLTEEWQLGSDVSYVLEVPVPGDAPAGRYRIAAGIWDGRENRLPEYSGTGCDSLKISAGNRVIVGERLTVERPGLVDPEHLRSTSGQQ